jgi:hypothetical protein
MANEVFDESTGEIITEPRFVKLYIEDICRVKGLTAPLHKMFNFMLCNMNYENITSYGASSKRTFLKESGIANSTFDNNVSKLIKANLIQRVAKGEFRVNKKYAVKVSWPKVQSIEWTTKYTANGKEETVKFNEVD